MPSIRHWTILSIEDIISFWVTISHCRKPKICTFLRLNLFQCLQPRLQYTCAKTEQKRAHAPTKRILKNKTNIITTTKNASPYKKCIPNDRKLNSVIQRHERTIRAPCSTNSTLAHARELRCVWANDRLRAYLGKITIINGPEIDENIFSSHSREKSARSVIEIVAWVVSPLDGERERENLSAAMNESWDWSVHVPTRAWAVFPYAVACASLFFFSSRESWPVVLIRGSAQRICGIRKSLAFSVWLIWSIIGRVACAFSYSCVQSRKILGLYIIGRIFDLETKWIGSWVVLFDNDQ